MQSRPRLDPEVKVILLILLLFLAGASLPFDHLREVMNNPYQGGTYLFLSFLVHLLQKQNSLQTFDKHPDAVSTLFNYFAKPENYNESYWWLQHQQQLLNLFADEETFLILAKSPWLFRSLHSLIDYSPHEFDKAISNRTFFNDLLNVASDYPELRTILTTSPLSMVIVIEEPSLLPYIKSILKNDQIRLILLEDPQLFPFFLANPGLSLPQTSDWILFLQPANNTSVRRPVSVLILIHSIYTADHTDVTLIQNRTLVRILTGSMRPLNNTHTYLENATLNPANLTSGNYYLLANVTLYSSSSVQFPIEFLTQQIIIYLGTGTQLAISLIESERL